MKATTKEAYQLLHRGVEVLSWVEHNGIRIDEDHLDQSLDSLGDQIRNLQHTLRADRTYDLWRREYGEKTNLGSLEQLAHVLFEVEKHPYRADFTATGRFKADEAIISTVDTPFVKDYLRWTKLRKMRNTFLTGIRRETVDGFLHPVFNLHTVSTFRSSSSDPNFQNFPIRIPEFAEIIRKCFVARPGRVLIEIDYSGIEVRIAACYHKDPMMLEYIRDPTKDMHRDMAAECYLLETKEVSKMARYCNPPEAPIWMSDLSFKPIGEIKVGDRVMGWAREDNGKNSGKRGHAGNRKRLVRSIVTAVHRHVAPIVKVTMKSGKIIRCTADHQWINGKMQFRGKDSYTNPKVGAVLAHVVNPPPVLKSEEEIRAAAWLGGMYDGEGSRMGIGQSPEHNPEICDRIEECLGILGFDYTPLVHRKRKGQLGKKKFVVYQLRGGLQTEINFLSWCQPVKRRPISARVKKRSSFFKKDEIVSVEPDGCGEVIGLTTTTGNYVAWGFASKNCAKNMFVFPQFYGSYYLDCATHLWEAIDKLKLKVEGTDVPLKKHLKSKGIKERGDCDRTVSRPRPGTFEDHIRQVEDRFWNERFRVYSQWKKDTWEQYLKDGEFQMLTGFTVQGLMKRNEVLNYGVQGCLAGSSRVLTRHGLVPIRELVGKHTEVWTGFCWADAAGLEMGKCRRAVIRLSSGLVIRCDTRHKLKNELDQWVEFDDLRVGDWVALPRNKDPLDASADMNWWFVFGFIIGDGSLGSKRDGLSITVGLKKRGILEKIKEFLVGQGYKDGGYGGVHWRVIPPSGNKKEKYNLSLENAEFASFLKRNGFVFGWKSKTKRIPSSVWTASPQEQRDFMEGLWMSDGCRLPSAEKNLNMTNPRLLREVQILISRLGFDSALRGGRLHVLWRAFNSKTHRRYPAKAILRQVDAVRSENYRVVGGFNESEYVTDHRNFSRAKKGKDVSQYVAERIVARNSGNRSLLYRYDRITSIEVLDREEMTYTLSVDDPLHQYVADGVIQKNCAFHCLLWSLVQIQEWIVGNKLKTKIVGQIHDSILADVPIREVQDYLTNARRIMTEELPRAWKWINVPLEVEAEITPEGGSWHDKVQWVEKGGVWGPKEKAV